VAERRDRAPAEQAEERVVFSTWHDEQMCFVCYRVADMPTPRVPSFQRPCAGCGAPIWVAKKSPTALPKICIRCTGPSAWLTHLSGCVRYFHRHAQGNVRPPKRTCFSAQLMQIGPFCSYW